jgi:hypothetical protein
MVGPLTGRRVYTDGFWEVDGRSPERRGRASSRGNWGLDRLKFILHCLFRNASTEGSSGFRGWPGEGQEENTLGDLLR